MTTISEIEFHKICFGIKEDAESIFRHNPVGNREETLLWMLMSSLIFYLSLDEKETPCFTGIPNAETYRKAIGFILTKKKAGEFDHLPYIELMVN